MQKKSYNVQKIGVRTNKKEETYKKKLRFFETIKKVCGKKCKNTFSFFSQ